jgi:putative copper export protein
MEIAVIVGLVVLILSWIVPPFIKDTLEKRFVRMVLSALSVGICIGYMLCKLF